MARKKQDIEAVAEAKAYNVEARDTYTGARIFYNDRTGEQFTRPDHIFKVEALTAAEADEICKRANATAAAKGWGITFEVVKFSPYTEDVNTSPFTTW